jgi:RND family efflux transporter MFP subunit
VSATPPSLASLRIDRDPPATPGRGRFLVSAALAMVAAAAVVAWLLLAPRPIPVRVQAARATGGGTLSSEGISANGYVVARTKASVAAKISGRLEYLGVSEGSRVRRGQIIARVESGDYAAALAGQRAQLAQFEAQLAQARRELERAKALRERGVNSETELEDARTRVDVLVAQTAAASAQVDLATVNLENTRLRAPFDGTVLRKDAEVGEIVAPSAAGGGLTRTAIVTMADLGTLEVEVDVNEAYIAQIRGGQPAAITLDAYPDTAFAGNVRQVVPTADRQKATVLVKVAILDRDPRILPEMGAKVVFLRKDGAAAAAAPRRVTVPKSALIATSEGAHVWIVADGRAVKRNVEAGPERGDEVEIRGGLDGGEPVIVAPPAGLKNGARVRASGT